MTAKELLKIKGRAMEMAKTENKNAPYERQGFYMAQAINNLLTIDINEDNFKDHLTALHQENIQRYL